MYSRFLAVAGAAATAALLAGSASAARVYDADLADPGVYFGSGNPNGHFAVDTRGGVEVGLRARPYPLVPIAPTLDNVYDVALGDTISVDYSVNPSVNGAEVDLSGISALLTIVNKATGQAASFDPSSLLLGNDTDPGAPGGYQNSERLSFGFIAIPMGGYDANTDNTYRVTLSLKGAGGTQRDTIWVNQGSGLAGFTIPGVPEPASWALMILGFGGVGASLRRGRPASQGA